MCVDESLWLCTLLFLCSCIRLCVSASGWMDGWSWHNMTLQCRFNEGKGTELLAFSDASPIWTFLQWSCINCSCCLPYNQSIYSGIIYFYLCLNISSILRIFYDALKSIFTYISVTKYVFFFSWINTTVSHRECQQHPVAPCAFSTHLSIFSLYKVS